MQILVVAATAFEIRPLLKKLPLIGRQTEEMSRYQYKNLVIDVLISGVGMIPTSYLLGKHLALKHYDFAVNAGIAGTFNKSLPLGAVVEVTEDCVPELGAEDGDGFLSVFDLGLTDPDVLPYTGGRLINDCSYDSLLNSPMATRNLPVVKGITSNTVRGNATSIARILKLSDADVESMEGAAFFYACLSAQVPCMQVRAISNYVEERDKSRWSLDLALKNLNKFLGDLLFSGLKQD